MPMFLLEGFSYTAISICSHKKASVCHCFLSDSCRGTVGARLSRARVSADSRASAEKLTVTQIRIVTVTRHKCPLLLSWQEGAQTRLTWETAWLWAVWDIKSDHGMKNSRRHLYWNNILFTYSTLGRRHTYMARCFIYIIRPVDSFTKWCLIAGWLSSSFLLKAITLFFSWCYIILFPEDKKDLSIHSTNIYVHVLGCVSDAEPSWAVFWGRGRINNQQSKRRGVSDCGGWNGVK